MPQQPARNVVPPEFMMVARYIRSRALGSDAGA
jgi:hypothetical protein